jgi:hypothetical protein
LKVSTACRRSSVQVNSRLFAALAGLDEKAVIAQLIKPDVEHIALT